MSGPEHNPADDVQPTKKVEPLRKRTMTLNELQVRTANVIRLVKFQFGRAAYGDGMTDAEFIEDVLDPLATDIYQDRQILKDARKRRNEQE